mgnify:FL=1
MKLKESLISAIFVARPNRFITIININGKDHKSHLPDPGRLKELLVVGCKLWVRYVKNNSNRKTNYTTVFVEHKGKLISLISTLPNTFVKESLMANTLPIYKEYKLIKPEVAVHNHRIDFLLKNQSGIPFYLEIKSVTYVQKGVAKFPDAVTRRGFLHLKLLQDLISQGYQAGVLFVCQREDALSFQPMWERDPHFSSALLEACSKGVKINCITLNISKSQITFNTEISLNLEKPD